MMSALARAAGPDTDSSAKLVIFSRLWDRYALARLIALYEENYRLCMDLLDVARAGSNGWCLTADSALPPLSIAILDRAPYTLTLQMEFEKGGPELVVSCRLYLDLKVCDALFFMDRRQVEGTAQGQERGLQNQWADGLRFQKWLYYLKDQGYASQRL